MTPPEAPEKYRLFIALPLPESVKAEIEKARARLRAAVSEGSIRWTTREQFHLTLKFLGSVPANGMDALVQSVTKALKDFRPMALCAAGVGFFPNARRPRVIWIGVQDKKDFLAKLHCSIEEATRSFTNEKLQEKFIGHVTLGRVREIGRRDAEALAKVATEMTKAVFGNWSAGEIAIMRSQLSPKGATHTCLATIPLGIQGAP